MGLDLRTVLALDHDVRGGEALPDVAPARLSRPAHVAVDGQPNLRDEFARRTPGRGSRGCRLSPTPAGAPRRDRRRREAACNRRGRDAATLPPRPSRSPRRRRRAGRRSERPNARDRRGRRRGRSRALADRAQLRSCRWRAPRHAHGATGGCGQTAYLGTSTVKRIAPVTFARPLSRGYGLPMTASWRSAAAAAARRSGPAAFPRPGRRRRFRPEMSRFALRRSRPWGQLFRAFAAASVAATTWG